MQRDALLHYQLYSRIFEALNDPTESASLDALLDLSEDIQTLDFPIIITDPDGIPAHASNLPFEADPSNPADHLRLYEYAMRLARVHAPLLAPSLAAAALLVFVDVLKELPATFALRPFNFDTLAIEAYNLAKDERLAEAAVPSLVIVAVGLLPVLYVSKRYFQATRS